jgi:AcrR family transcriptional regulator
MSDAIQQQLIAARKNQILDAAAAVFAEKGFHPSTTKDIARRAGISEGTIYNYFDSKTALLLGIFERMRATVIQENLPLPSPDMDFREMLKLFLQQPLMGFKRDNFALFRIIVSEMMVSEELQKLYYQQIMEPTLEMAEGFFVAHAAKQGIDPTTAKLTVRAISGMVLGLMLERIMGDGTLAEQWDALPDLLADLLINGIKV